MSPAFTFCTLSEVSRLRTTMPVVCNYRIKNGTGLIHVVTNYMHKDSRSLTSNSDNSYRSPMAISPTFRFTGIYELPMTLIYS